VILKTQAAVASAARTEAEMQARLVAEAAAAEEKQAIDREHERADALTRDLAAAREELETLKTQTAVANPARTEAETQARLAADASAAEQRQALDREHERADALSRDLNAAREQVQSLTARHVESSQAMQAANAAAAGDKQALVQERQQAATLARDLAAARQDLQALRTSVATRNTPQGGAPEPTAVGAISRRGPSRNPVREQDSEARVSSPPAISRPEDEALLVRADALLEQRDIIGARLLLERAAAAGSARAVFLLAETYDPRMLSSWRTYGLRRSAEGARALRTGLPGRDWSSERADRKPQICCAVTSRR
jgi:hypothetical protein